MSKGRFTTTDVKAMVRDLRSLLGKRVANVYDLNDKTYLFKFAVPGQSAKTLLLLESGVRFHTTKYARDLPDLPSPFSMKLRRAVRGKRLEEVRQMGEDRVVNFKFGSGEFVHHVILELYSNGNIILADANYEVIALLHAHTHTCTSIHIFNTGT
ncbi:fibronectin-binding protein A N-terminus-domain-containing protein [Ochromonadaceae sp. CCMP2298]|nr:fibronectin-binding protein A N-terminus-domain-containing protein [Ochromonadaceae sp. CCMP2298]